MNSEIFVHQETYIIKMLKFFYIDNVYPLYTSMDFRSLNIKIYPFIPREDEEEILGPKVP